MFFYLFHNINHSNSSNKVNENYGAKNVRTMVLGGICYIILHAMIFTESNPLYFYGYYIYYMFLLDVSVMAVIYKMYYSRSILNELKEISQIDNDTMLIKSSNDYVELTQPSSTETKNSCPFLESSICNNDAQNENTTSHEKEDDYA